MPFQFPYAAQLPPPPSLLDVNSYGYFHGNTDQLYAENGRLLMAQSLVDQHPDVTKMVRKFGRWQHHVDYGPFADNMPVPATTRR